MRKLLVLVASAAVVTYLAGCGGGGSTGGGGTSHTGVAQIGFSGGGGGGAPSAFTLTIDSVDTRPTGGASYTGHWTGSAVINILQSVPTFCSITTVLGSDVMATCDSFKFHVSHVHIVDNVAGDLDADTDITLTFGAHLQIGAGRTSQIWLVLMADAITRNGQNITIDSNQILLDNNIAQGQPFKSHWADAAGLDLTHLSPLLTLPQGGNVTGLWFSGDHVGPYVEQSASGGDWYLIDDQNAFQLGSFTYTDSSKAGGAYSIILNGFTNTGTWTAITSLITLTHSAWTVVAVPESNSGNGVFAFLHTNASGQIDQFVPGQFTLTDQQHPTSGGTFHTFPAQELVSTQGPHTFYDGTFTMASNMQSGTYTYTGSHPNMPATGTWVMFVPAH